METMIQATEPTPTEATSITKPEPETEPVAEPIERMTIPEPETQPAPQPANSPDDDAATEAKLADEINTLWGDHVRLSADRKVTAKELRQIRAALAQRLYAVKSIISRPDAGRGGRWRSWLRERKIPRSTADRLVARHSETLGAQSENVLTEATKEPTTSDVLKLFKTLWPKMQKVLTTHDSALTFLGIFVAETCLRYEWREDGLMVFNPDAEEQATEDSTEADDGDDDGESGEVIE